MAGNNQRKQKQKQRKLRQRKAKEQKKNAQSALIVVPAPSARIGRKLNEIYDWLDDGEVDEVRALLAKLVKNSPRCAAVAEVELDVYRQLRDHENSSRAAKRFLGLVPQNPDAMFGYAQSAMFCSRASIALLRFRKFLDRWPQHELAENARDAIGICEPESRSRVSVANEEGGLELDFDEGGLEFYARHEESLEQMTAHNFPQTIALLERNIKQQPGFMSSRNNLVICRFYNGDYENAVREARAISQFAPENRFAQANLLKYEFLTGNPEQANQIADQMIADPPTSQDPFTATVAGLSFLGRDENVIALSSLLEQVTPMDPDKLGCVLHYFAVANFRLGDREEAARLWQECLDVFPRHPEAIANVQDIASEIGHAAWGESIGKWLPLGFVENILEGPEDKGTTTANSLANNNPVIATLIPALLDRGDPDGREFALKFAGADATEPMLAALKDFAFSDRGPDQLRHDALTTLKENEVIDTGPHRFFSKGNWTEIKLIASEITGETFETEPWKAEPMERGYWAMQQGDFETAEEAFESILDRDPDCASARFNLAGVWQQRRHGDEPDKAERAIRRLHEDHPDYLFAALAVAMFEAEEENFDQAHELLKRVYEKPRLHTTEAMMLFSSHIQIALLEDDVQAAESAWSTLCQIADESAPNISVLRRKIDRHFGKTDDRGLTKFLS